MAGFDTLTRVLSKAPPGLLDSLAYTGDVDTALRALYHALRNIVDAHVELVDAKQLVDEVDRLLSLLDEDNDEFLLTLRRIAAKALAMRLG